MARILEHHAKAVLKHAGVPVPRGRAVTTPEEARNVASRIGGKVVVKPLVPVGGRAKSGSLEFASDAQEARRAADRLLHSTVRGYQVRAVLVERTLDVERELFFSVAIDKQRRRPVAMASLEGGVDLNTIIEQNPTALAQVTLDVWGRFLPHQIRELWSAAGLDREHVPDVAELSIRVARLFFELQATLVEVNPIGILKSGRGEGRAASKRTPRVVALSAVIVADDQAFARGPRRLATAEHATERLWREPTELERRADEVASRDPHRGSSRFIQLDGDIGFLCGGGGGSLVFFDALIEAGGRPACYTEIGGNPTAEKVRDLALIVLSCPSVKGLLVGHNITNNTQVDLVASGVVEALRQKHLDPARFPVVAREIGTNDTEGRRILEAAGIDCLDESTSMEEAARRIVHRVGSEAV